MGVVTGVVTSVVMVVVTSVVMGDVTSVVMGDVTGDGSEADTRRAVIAVGAAKPMVVVTRNERRWG